MKYLIHPYLSTIKDDDLYSVISDFWPDHGEYLTAFLSEFFVLKLPELLHIHPQNFVDPYGVLIRSIIFVFGCYVLASFVFVENCKKTFMPFFIVFAFYLILYSFHYEYRAFYLYAAFFRFYFPFVLSMLFWFIIYKNSLNDNKTDKKFPISIIIAFLAGYSSEFVSLFSSAALLIIGFIKLLNKEIKYNKNFFLSFSFIAGNILVVIQSYYIFYSNCYIQGQNVSLKLFFNEYWNFVIVQHFVPLLIIIALFFILKVMNKTDKSISIPLIGLTLSPYIVMFLFIFCGFYHYDNSHSWLFHGHFHQVIEDILFCIQFFMIGKVFSSLSENQNNKKNISIILLLIISFEICYCFDGFSKYCTYSKTSHKEDDKINTYITDKMFLFYILKNKPIILGNKFVHNTIGIVNPDIYSPDISETDVKNSRWFGYIGLIYPNVADLSKYNKSNKIYFKSEDDAKKEFYNNGGVFVDDEITELDFNKLNDKNFILNIKE